LGAETRNEILRRDKMKKLILIGAFLLIASTSHAADRWTGPTSPIDPMWGLSGSSIMAEALRDQSNDFQIQQDIRARDRKIQDQQDEINSLKSKQSGSSTDFYIDMRIK
jgi:hypothetical protein